MANVQLTEEPECIVAARTIDAFANAPDGSKRWDEAQWAKNIMQEYGYCQVSWTI